MLVAYVEDHADRSTSRTRRCPTSRGSSGCCAGYFPPPIAERFADDLPNHPLHREIITTVVVNDMINRGGTTFVHRAIEETGADVAQIARAYAVVREVFDLPALWAEIEALDNQVPTAAQHAGYQEIRRLIDRATRWLVDVRFPISDVAARDRAVPARRVRRAGPRISGRCCAARSGRRSTTTPTKLIDLGLPARAGAAHLAELLTRVPAARRRRDRQRHRRTPPPRSAELHFALSERFSVDEHADRDHRAAPRRPLVDPGPGGRAARRLRRAVGDHDVGAAHHRRRLLGDGRASTAWTDAERRAGRAGADDGARRAGPRRRRPGDAVGGAAGSMRGLPS